MIYCLEDDDNIRELVVYTLNQTGLEAQGFDRAAAFYAACEKALPSLALLDIMLPGEDGVSVLRTLRQGAATRGLPVIMLTAKATEYDRVLGLDSGADDYLCKPFGMTELVARVKALLRRAAPPGERALEAGGIYLDLAGRTATADGEEIKLTLKEYELLRFLLENKGVAFTRDRLLETVWGYDYSGGTRTVDVHVQTLRQKLKERGGLIQTVRGIGYKLGSDK